MTIPTETALYTAEDFLRTAADYAYLAARDGDASSWHKLTGHLQDALYELGYDLVPLKQQPPATREQLFTAWDYAASRGEL